MGNIAILNGISVKLIRIATFFAIASSIIVLVFNYKFDGQVIYDRIVVYYGMIVIDMWICVVLYKIGQYIKRENCIKVLNHLDKISYEFYIVHGLIILVATQPLLIKLGVIAYIFCIVILSCIGAWILHGVCNLVYRKIK